MDGIKGGGGGGREGVGVEDMGDGMQCSDHPYRNNPGSICAFCLEEKLGKLVSSSFPLPTCGSSSSSSSHSFKSDIGSVGVGGSTTNGGGSTSLSLVVCPTATKLRDDNSHFQDCHTRRARIPFLLANKNKITMASSSEDSDIVYKGGKSTSPTPGRRQFLDAATDYSEDFSPRKRGGFWSFLYPSSSKSSNGKKKEKVSSLKIRTTAANGSSKARPKQKCPGSSLSNKGHVNVALEGDDSPISQATTSAKSFERKVSRSRSVGCGSRSLSGDFFERISTGFGDCTLRRVESQREGKPKVAATSNMKEMSRCGGIFGRFIVTSSSSSSSSSSRWVSSSAEDMNGRATAGSLSHGRSRSWGWAFVSPMRAFSKPSSKDGKRDIIRETSSKNAAPNSTAIPSLLAMKG